MGKPKIKAWFGTKAVSLARFQRKHWVYTLILVDLSSFWLPLLYSFEGKRLCLVNVIDQPHMLTPLGSFIMAAFLVIVFIGKCATYYDEKINGRNAEVKELKAKLLEQTEDGIVLYDLSSSANSICEGKLSTLIDRVDYFITHPTETPPVISNPQKQLDLLVKELSICLAGLLKFKDRRNVEDLFTSIIYRFPQDSDKDWRWANSERGLSISDLLTEQDGRISTFRSLIEKRGHTVFKNSKQSAFDSKQYLPDNEDEYDEDGKLNGSIACFQYEIKKNNRTVIEFVITITSYSQQFVQGMADGDEVVKNVKHNLEKVVMPNYVVRAKIELCLLYIKHLNEGKR